MNTRSDTCDAPQQVECIIWSTFSRFYVYASDWQVFERSKSYRPCGAGITLDVNGMKSLRSVDEALYTKLQSAAAGVAGNTMFDQSGELCLLRLFKNVSLLSTLRSTPIIWDHA